ncbi:hypothetical protein BU15DRAFT_73115 [Melanogaster broomeanus]|nr:hypothetical protein BU15DRAFT_73115 [Melanogaster broomeanus]
MPSAAIYPIPYLYDLAVSPVVTQTPNEESRQQSNSNPEPSGVVFAARKTPHQPPPSQRQKRPIPLGPQCYKCCGFAHIAADSLPINPIFSFKFPSPHFLFLLTDYVSLEGFTRVSSTTNLSFSLTSSPFAPTDFFGFPHKEDLVNILPFRDEALKNAASWYQFAYHNLGHAEINNDSLYLITGYHKARSWSLASFSRADGSEGAALSFSLTAGPVVNGNITAAYSWARGVKGSCHLFTFSRFTLSSFHTLTLPFLFNLRFFYHSYHTRFTSSLPFYHNMLSTWRIAFLVIAALIATLVIGFWNHIVFTLSFVFGCP